MIGGTNERGAREWQIHPSAPHQFGSISGLTVPKKSSACCGMLALEFLLDFVLESEHGLAGLVFA